MANGSTSVALSPLFQHPENDRRSFRMFTAQLICQGTCRQVEIVRAFGVSKNSVIRSVNTYRAGGVERVLRTSCGTRCFGYDAGGYRPSTAIAGGRLEPKRSRRATGPQARHAPQGNPARTTDRALHTRSGRVSTARRSSSKAAHRDRQVHAGHPGCRRQKWARRAPGRTNASWRHSVF